MSSAGKESPIFSPRMPKSLAPHAEAGCRRKSGTSERAHGKDFGRCCALKHGRRCGGVCGRRAEKRGAGRIVFAVQTWLGREARRAAAAQWPVCRGRQSKDAAGGMRGTGRIGEGVVRRGKAKKPRRRKGQKRATRRRCGKDFAQRRRGGLFPDGRSPLRPLAPGWNARSFRALPRRSSCELVGRSFRASVSRTLPQTRPSTKGMPLKPFAQPQCSEAMTCALQKLADCFQAWGLLLGGSMVCTLIIPALLFSPYRGPNNNTK